jgi:hypothetical protein
MSFSTNLNTHKPKPGRWLARHKNVHFHFTPTHASWLNQIECWFFLLGGQSLRGTSFTAVPSLRKHINAFVASYNQTARPFAWSKSEVHQKRLRPRFGDLRVLGTSQLNHRFALQASKRLGRSAMTTVSPY